ncbi:TPR end-of-group domain-containing protein [Clostridium uliginosum]|uniref:TPR end-of-group domain-containing protein n=1 Tax=Clostridium uliginosum TaxID=119641 RepID=UPI0011136F2F|nr:hypothetical protein [Clostridium uliginosum]
MKQKKKYFEIIKIDEDGDLNKAKEYYKKAIQKNPNYDKAYFYVNIGENLKVLIDVKKSIELNELFLDYMKKDNELDPIRNLEGYKELIL